MYYSSKTVISQYVSVNSNRTFLFFPPLRYNVLAKEDFAMKDEFITRVGVLGQRHYNYLKKHFPTVINVMRMNGTLEQYLKDIEKMQRKCSISW